MDVESFNEEEVVMVTEMGVVVLSGQDLHITKLNLDDGQLVAEGQIIAMESLDTQKSGKKEGLFSRVFR